MRLRNGRRGVGYLGRTDEGFLQFLIRAIASGVGRRDGKTYQRALLDVFTILWLSGFVAYPYFTRQYATGPTLWTQRERPGLQHVS